MPSDKCNSITAKDTDLIFSLLNVALARQPVSDQIPQAVDDTELCFVFRLNVVF